MKNCLALLLSICLCGSVAAAYKDGSYTAEGSGNAGPIKVEVRISNSKIESIKVLKHGETPELLAVAEKKVGKAIIKANGTDGVDAVTGATNSSHGVLEAVKKALKQASEK